MAMQSLEKSAISSLPQHDATKHFPSMVPDYQTIITVLDRHTSGHLTHVPTRNHHINISNFRRFTYFVYACMQCNISVVN